MLHDFLDELVVIGGVHVGAIWRYTLDCLHGRFLLIGGAGALLLGDRTRTIKPADAGQSQPASRASARKR